MFRYIGGFGDVHVGLHGDINILRGQCPELIIWNTFFVTNSHLADEPWTWSYLFGTQWERSCVCCITLVLYPHPPVIRLHPSPHPTITLQPHLTPSHPHYHTSTPPHHPTLTILHHQHLHLTSPHHTVSPTPQPHLSTPYYITNTSVPPLHTILHHQHLSPPLYRFQFVSQRS